MDARTLFIAPFENLAPSNELREAMTIHREAMVRLFLETLLDFMSWPDYGRAIYDMFSNLHYFMPNVIEMMDG